MKTKRLCKRCLWNDQCGQDHPCDDFDPIYDNRVEAEYNMDLHMRHEEYFASIAEMRGNALERETQIRHLKCDHCKKRTPHYKEQYEILKMDGAIEYSMYEDYWTCSVCRKQPFKYPCQSQV